MVQSMKTKLGEMFQSCTLPQGFKPEYGTAGFRSKADNLDAIVFRCSVLMSMRASIIGKYCGIMITASHNPECDNGVKLVDYNGEMIDEDWQKHATNLAQTDDFDAFWDYIQKLVTVPKYRTHSTSVFIGTDTRQSGKRLSCIATEAIGACGVQSIHLGNVTTPELHFYTKLQVHPNAQNVYTQHLIDTFKSLLVEHCTDNDYTADLHVDCANGVGACKLIEMKPRLLELGLNLILYNIGDGQLNHKCGADYVEKEHKFPLNMHGVPEYARCCSFDGDADRIVYFTKINGLFEILNGDKIACLFVKYLSSNISIDCNIGLIQTAYANGASTKYIADNYPNVNIKCTHTGVQHLHKAAQNFDIGIYFEANGHGTVIFNTNVSHPLSKTLSQVTGDAIGNMLAIECILQTNTNFKEWINLYKDYYTKQVKIFVDKNAFETAYYGRVCIKPLGLQKEIDIIVGKYTDANTRAFVRPSGTEDLVRLYVESSKETCLIDVSDNIQHAIACR